MQKFICVRFQVEGTHRWVNCLYEDVAFLKDWHRHVFYFSAEIEVTHSSRELEFIKAKRYLQRWVERVLLLDPVELSCEQLAEAVLVQILSKYGTRQVSVSCFEDGENGARISN